MKKLSVLVSLISLIGCEKYNHFEEIHEGEHLDLSLFIYSDLPYENDIYTFDYPEGATSSHFKIHYNSLPLQRVFWDSPDNFYVIMWQDTMWTPVINFSTYADEEGLGHQMVYVNPTLIGDTLNLLGVTSSENYPYITIEEEILVKIQ